MNDFFEEMFDVQVPAGYQEKKWVEMIQDLMIKAKMGDRGLEWDTTNPTTKFDGSDFPTKDFSIDFTPFYQIVEKLTSDEYTGDGQYIYYITSDGTKRYLTIRSKQGTTVSGTLVEGTDTRKIKIDKAKDDVKNYVIYFSGNDLYGNVIRFFEADYDSIAKVGYKFHYMIEETANLSEIIVYQEAYVDELTGGANFNFANGKWTDSDHFPLSYNYVWKAWKLNSATVTSTDDDDFNDDLRDIAKEQGANFAKRLINSTTKPRYNTSINYAFRNDLTLGGSYQVDLPSRNINRELRIKEMRYSVNGTDVKFEEDENKATL